MILQRTIQPDNLTKTMCVVIATITAPAELLGFLYFTIFNFKRKKEEVLQLRQYLHDTHPWSSGASTLHSWQGRAHFLLLPSVPVS